MIILCILLSTLENLIIHGYTLGGQSIQIILLTIMTTLSIAKPKSEWIHKLVVSVLVLVMLTSLAVTWNLWLIKS